MARGCPSCRAVVNPGQPYCHSCGRPLTKYAWDSPPPPNPVSIPAGGGVVYATARRTDGGAIASMIVGILGLIVLPIIASIVAIALGYGARRRIRANGTLDGDGFATAGIVTGWIGIVLFGVIFLIALGAAASSSY